MGHVSAMEGGRKGKGKGKAGKGKAAGTCHRYQAGKRIFCTRVNTAGLPGTGVSSALRHVRLGGVYVDDFLFLMPQPSYLPSSPY